MASRVEYWEEIKGKGVRNINEGLLLNIFFDVCLFPG
jgi:hypothetical protein